MHIDSYQFGRIVIDGVAYTSDCLILGDTVQGDWWRQEGHRLMPQDVQAVLAHRPATLVVGCGALRMMKVDAMTRDLLHRNQIVVVASETGQAVVQFNALSRQGVNVAAALHLTC